MPRYPIAELRQAYEHFKEVSDRCAANADYNAFADLFTESEMVRYTHDWVYFDEDNGRVVFCARTHMSDPGDGSEMSATNWTRIDYAGNGQWSREEDIYNPANFGQLLTDWQNAKEKGGT